MKSHLQLSNSKMNFIALSISSTEQCKRPKAGSFMRVTELAGERAVV